MLVLSVSFRVAADSNDGSNRDGFLLVRFLEYHCFVKIYDNWNLISINKLC